MGWYQRRVHGGATFRMDCKLFLVIASVVVLASLDLKNQAAARSCGNVRSEGITVFNFTDVNTDVSDWVEVSDNVRTTIVGQSKATLVLQKNSAFQRGIFFGLLNPQVGGACFAGVRHPIKLELAPASLFTLLLRAQGALTHFKVILRHHGELGSKFPTYEHTFEVPTGGDELRPVFFSIFEFKPYTNGTLNMMSIPWTHQTSLILAFRLLEVLMKITNNLDRQHLRSIGFQLLTIVTQNLALVFWAEM